MYVSETIIEIYEILLYSYIVVLGAFLQVFVTGFAAERQGR